MSENKYTPGPWESVRHSNSLIGIRQKGSGDDLCQVVQPAGRREQKANAHLIAAAPELLEALKNTLSWLTSYPGEGTAQCYAKARAAIAKAEGPR
jgi:hypothetical protein